MQLQSATPPAPPTDLAAGLETCARDRGQRPAVTVLSRQGRAEQGFITLAQWAAKGSHLLQTDLFLEPGGRVLVDVPPGWTLAAVCTAIWWVGGTVVLGDHSDATDVGGAVVHESRPRPDVPEVYLVGDALDGSVTTPTDAYVWAEEVQAFPDQPPARAAAATLPTLDEHGVTTTHGDLIAALAPERGVLGVDLATFAGPGVREAAARPLVTGRATVVLRDVDRAAAAGDNVATWA